MMYHENTTWKAKTKWEEHFLRFGYSFFSKELTMGMFNVRTTLEDKILPKQKALVQEGVGLGPLSLLFPQYISFLPGIAPKCFPGNWAAQKEKSGLSSQTKGQSLQSSSWTAGSVKSPD